MIEIEPGVYQFRIVCSHKDTNELFVEYEDELVQDIESLTVAKKRLQNRLIDYGYVIVTTTYKKVK